MFRKDRNPFYMSDDEIELDALEYAARWFVFAIIAVFIGCTLIPVVMP